MVVIWLLLKFLQDMKDKSQTYIIAQPFFLLSFPLSIIVPLFSLWSSIWKSSGVILVNQTEFVCVCVCVHTPKWSRKWYSQSLKQWRLIGCNERVIELTMCVLEMLVCYCSHNKDERNWFTFLLIFLLFELKEPRASARFAFSSSAFDSAVRERLQKDPPTHSHHMSSKNVWELDHPATHTHTYSTANGPRSKISWGRVMLDKSEKIHIDFVLIVFFTF